MSEPLIKVILLSKRFYLRRSHFLFLLNQLIKQLHLLFLNWVLLEKVVVKSHELRLFLHFNWLNYRVYYLALNCSDDLKMEGTLSVQPEVVWNDETLSFVPFDELILKHLKCVDKWFVVFLQPDNFLLQRMGLHSITLQLFEELLVLSCDFLIFLLQSNKLLFKCLD